MPRKVIVPPMDVSAEELASRLMKRPKEKSPPILSVESWAVSVDKIFSDSDVRLDAAHFDPDCNNSLKELRKSGLKLKPLSSLASVELRNRFTRVWAEDRKYGIPYVNATDLMSLLASGLPSGKTRYLSHATETDVERLIIREGWLLMTCSGTIGRVFYVSKRLNGWVATHDLIRVMPEKAEMAGYLYAWLTTPMAQTQILRHTHGGQIDHVTDEQVSDILVPVLSQNQTENINAKVMRAILSREKAIQALTSAWQAR